MAALTTDRIAEKKLQPRPTRVPRVVNGAAGTVYRNALVGTLADGTVEPVQAGGTYVEILLSDERLEAGERGEFLSGAIVEVLTDFAADASVNGDAVFGIDDQTCSDVQADGPQIGTVYSVINAGRVFVDTRNLG